MNDPLNHSGATSASLEQIRELVNSDIRTAEKLATLEQMKGQGRSLLGKEFLQEPPNYEGYIYMRLPIPKGVVTEVNWYPTQARACAEFMIDAAELFGDVPKYEVAAEFMKPWSMTQTGSGAEAIIVEQLTREKYLESIESVRNGETHLI